jgi:ParB-like chromosome segregation protein Spo0J
MGGLKPHPENARLYGATSRSLGDLEESVRAVGVLEPLLITGDNLVIAGHRRLEAATRAGLDKVPVVVYDGDELQVLKMLIHSNKQRVKSRSVIKREVKALMDVVRELAKRRQEESVARASQAAAAARRGEATVVAGVPPQSNVGKSRSKVGKALGISGNTVDKYAALANVTEQLEADGKMEDAQKIDDVLDRNWYSA